MEEKEKEIIKYYLENHSQKDTCKKFHIGNKKLLMIMKSNNIYIRKQ